MEPWKLWSLQTRNYIMVQVSEPFFTITAEIHACSLANFYFQYADRHMNLKFFDASASESRQFDNLLS